jgi:hypothetical protein
MSNEEEILSSRVRREQRLVAFISAVTAGSIMRKNMPACIDLESAAAEIIAFANAIERKSRDLFT